jgi:hypothetical protein
MLCAFSACAYADSIPTFHITQVNMFMTPNDGSGDNIRFTLTGPGVSITGIGGMACFDWCSGQPVSGDTPVITTQFSSQSFLLRPSEASATTRGPFPSILFLTIAAA